MAQITPASAIPPIREFPGIQAAVSRTYVLDMSSLTGTEVSADMATNLAASIAANNEPADDEANFLAEGGSTVGLWGFMPETGDHFLAGLIPVSGETLYPDPAQG